MRIRNLLRAILIAATVSTSVPVVAQRGHADRSSDHRRRDDRARRDDRREHRVRDHRDPHYTRVVVRESRPAVVVRASQRPRVVVVRPAPPPPRVHFRPAPPRHSAFWVEGYWEWRGNHYAWIDGHWERTRPHHRYVPAHWESRGHQWVFAPAVWVYVGPR